MKINSLDSDGYLKEYDVILTFHYDEFGRDYVVFTDSNYNEFGELQIYINEYIPGEFEVVSKKIQDENEYKKVRTKVNSMLLTLKNENEKLVLCE